MPIEFENMLIYLMYRQYNVSVTTLTYSGFVQIVAKRTSTPSLTNVIKWLISKISERKLGACHVSSVLDVLKANFDRSMDRLNARRSIMRRSVSSRGMSLELSGVQNRNVPRPEVGMLNRCKATFRWFARCLDRDSRSSRNHCHGR